MRRFVGSLLSVVLIAAALFAPVAPALASPNASLSGRVFLGSLGTPATAGAVSVQAVLVYEAGNPGPATNTQTDASGNFVVDGLEPGNYRLRFIPANTAFSTAYLPGVADWYAATTVAATVGGTSVSDMVVPQDASATVDVLLDGRAATAGEAFVRVYRDNNLVSGLFDYPTGANGRVTLSLDIGTYRLEAAASTDSYQSRSVVVGSSTYFTVAGGQTVTGSAALPPAGAFVGHVALSGAGSAGAGQVGVWSEELGSGSSAGSPISRAVTDASGNYSFLLWDGRYRLQFALTSGTGYQPTIMTVTVLDGVITPTVGNVTLSQTASLFGVVQLADTGPAGAGTVRVSALKLINGAFVDSPSWTVLTNSLGEYLIENLTAGSYHLHFEYLGSGSYVDEWWSDQVLSSQATMFSVGSSSTRMDAVLAAGSSISGLVTGTTGAPAPNVDVTAFLYPGGASQPMPYANVSTGSDGRYRLDGLPPGSYTLRAYYDSFTGLTEWWGSGPLAPTGSPLTVTAESNTTDVDIHVMTKGRVSGTIMCDGCATLPGHLTPVVGLETWSDADDEWVTALSDFAVAGSGYFSLTNVYPGTYRLFGSLSDDAYAISRSAPFEIASGDDLTRNIRIYSALKGATQSFVRATYMDVLDREAEPAGLADWTGRLLQGTSRDSVSSGILMSDEYRGNRIEQAYLELLGRPYEPAGREHWMALTRSGQVKIDEIELSFLGSQEYFNNAGGTAAYIDALYDRLLARDSSPSEEAAWSATIASRGRDFVVRTIYNSREAAAIRINAMYLAYLKRPAEPAGIAYWTPFLISRGDPALRASIVSSAEYWNQASVRFPPS